MVEKLKSALINEYNANPDSRTIIFAKTRELTMALESFMKEDTELSKLGPCRLVAVNAPSANAGQTPAEQQDILKKFGSGKRSVLVTCL